jgi:hypothetical protein
MPRIFRHFVAAHDLKVPLRVFKEESIMALRHLFVVTALFVVTGCTAEASGPSEPHVRLSGSLGSGATTTAKSFVGVHVDGNGAGLHVAARKLHKRGEAAATVRGVVGTDGKWSLDVTPGARWVVTIDSNDGRSSLVTFGNDMTAVEIGKDVNGATVDFGNLHIVGGEARSDVKINDYSIAQTIALSDEVFEAADGALVEAEAAVAAAEKAAEEAEKAAEDAQAAAEAAQKAAEEAQKAAGQ